MASPGLLLLLLVSSSLLLSTTSIPPPANQDQKNEIQKVVKGTFKYIREHPEQIKTLVTPFIGLIPQVGPFINAVVAVVLGEVAGNPVLDAIKTEFDHLNFKIDKYHKDQKWQTWATKYSDEEIKIEASWNYFLVTLKSVQETNDKNMKKKHGDGFIKFHQPKQDATENLYLLMKPTDKKSFTSPFGKLLVDHVNCHEKDIREYSVFINELIMKGTALNHLFYKLEGTECKANVDHSAETAYACASVMFQIHKFCILNSMDYVKIDVQGLIGRTVKDKLKLAHEVRSFLTDTYDTYDWMAVAFKTKSSKGNPKPFKRHILTGFTDVSMGVYTVGVARQVKGTHSKEKAGKVKQAIQKCVDKKVECFEVADVLGKCPETVDGVKVSDTYTAVHAYLHQAHHSIEAKDVEVDVDADPEDPSVPYIYTGECGDKNFKWKHMFVVMIKSDEEIRNKDPCSKLDCGAAENRGKCVRMEKTFVAMCDCNHPFYGRNCEETLEEYKKELQGSIDAFQAATSKALQTGFWKNLLSRATGFCKGQS